MKGTKGLQGLLDITEYYVRELIVRENPAYKAKESYEGEVKISYNIKRKGPELLFRIDMTAQVGSPKKMASAYPYYSSISLTGLFKFLGETDEDTIAKMIHLNGLSILYGIARGIVSQATSTSIHGKYILPTINFIEVIKRQSTKKALKKKSKKKS